MDINLKDVQKWYANKINKQVFELDSYDLFCAKVAYDYACENCKLIKEEKCKRMDDNSYQCPVCGCLQYTDKIIRCDCDR